MPHALVTDLEIWGQAPLRALPANRSIHLYPPYIYTHMRPELLEVRRILELLENLLKCTKRNSAISLFLNVGVRGSKNSVRISLAYSSNLFCHSWRVCTTGSCAINCKEAIATIFKRLYFAKGRRWLALSGFSSKNGRDFHLKYGRVQVQFTIDVEQSKTTRRDIQ